MWDSPERPLHGDHHALRINGANSPNRYVSLPRARRMSCEYEAGIVGTCPSEPSACDSAFVTRCMHAESHTCADLSRGKGLRVLVEAWSACIVKARYS
jgi:hypothetical protein